MIAESIQMKRVLQEVNRIAAYDASVLLTGKSGVGKSMLAKIIHSKSLNGGTIPLLRSIAGRSLKTCWNQNSSAMKKARPQVPMKRVKWG